MLKYKIKNQFQPQPEEIKSLEQGLVKLAENGFDDFLRNYLLDIFLSFSIIEQKKILEKLAEEKNPFLKSFGAEAAHISKDFLMEDFNFDISYLKKNTSLIYLRSLSMADRREHGNFSEKISKNINHHNFPESPCPNILADETPVEFIRQISQMGKKETLAENKTEKDLLTHVLNQFEKASIIPGTEMRHLTSLCPHAILRKWYMKTKISSCGTEFTFEGLQTSYGKGFDIESSRISCLMEMCERISSFASIEDLKITSRKKDPGLIKISYSRGLEKNMPMLDPNNIRLEIPYNDETLFWMKAEQALSHKNRKEIFIPAQLSYLFLNLPEPSLFSALDSTGLASGDTGERAKLGGIFEAVERDCDYSTPFTLESCFRIKSSLPEINTLFDFYKDMGVDFFFQDITNKSGIPAYRAFVYGIDKIIYKGCSSHLDSKKAIIDALFEVPFPLINNQPSARATYDLPYRELEKLPDYSQKNVKENLFLMESLFFENNLSIIYSELTRPDIEIPVFKTIIPGFEINGEFDEYSRISKRQYNNFKTIFRD